MKPKFSILIPVLMQHKYQYSMTVACINNIKAFSYNYEIIFLHSYASYGSDIKKHLRSQDTYIAFSNNPSQAEALNIGIKKARGDYIILIGNDNFVHQNWLSEIDKKLDDKNAQILACSVDRVPYEEYEPLLKEYSDERNGIKYNYFSYFNFQGVTIPKKIFTEIGLLDENLPFYFWERDLNNRLAEKGYTCGAVLTSLMTTPMSMTRLDPSLPEGLENWWTDESNTKEIEYFKKKWGVHP